MANPTIGEIDCNGCGVTGELRRCATGQRLFYWVCQCGKITPNLPTGQKGIFDKARFTDPEDKRQLGKYLERKIPGFTVAEQPEARPRVAANDAPEKPAPKPEPKPAHSGSWLDNFLRAE